MNNSDYELLVNKSFAETMLEIKKKYPQVIKNNENIDTEVQSECERLMPTVKPVIPALQLIEFLKSIGVKISINYSKSKMDLFVIDGLMKQYGTILNEHLNIIPNTKGEDESPEDEKKY